MVFRAKSDIYTGDFLTLFLGVDNEARQRPHQLQPTTLDLCEWTIIVTNLSVEQLSVEEALILLRLHGKLSFSSNSGNRF